MLGLAIATFLNVIGLSVGKWLHNLGAIGTWLPIAILFGIAATAWHRFGSATRFTPATMTPHMHFRDVLFMATIVYALGGSESASFLGDEVKDARRNLPRGLLAGGAFVTTGYILGTVAVLIALPAASSERPRRHHAGNFEIGGARRLPRNWCRSLRC